VVVRVLGVVVCGRHGRNSSCVVLCWREPRDRFI
jgi:hypothetical protein